MIRFLINRPIAVFVSFAALFMLGLTAAFFIPASILPNINAPEITVQMKLENASAAEIEQTAIAPLRSRLLQLQGLEDMESFARDGAGSIHLQFAHGTNIDLAFLEANEKIDLAMGSLPRKMNRPQAIKASASDIPAFYLNITLKRDRNARDNVSFTEFSDFVKQIIRRRLEQLPEVAMADVTGTDIPEVLIEPDENRMRILNITQENLQKALLEANINPGNILVKDGQYQYYLQFSAGFYSIDDINNIYINVHNRLWRLKEIAHVRLQAIKPKGLFLSDNQRAVSIAVIKQSGARMSELKKSTQHLIKEFQKNYPNVAFQISKDQTALLYYSISNLVQDLVIGGLLAFLFMLAFVRKIRSALLIGITIPVSLLISQVIFYMLGMSLNIISLSGLILGLGMIIDNSIVVIDNISQYSARGIAMENACVSGTVEVIRPLITSVFTNCSIFIPLIFLSGIAGAIFYDQAISIFIGLIISFLVAITLLPTLYKTISRLNFKNDSVERKPVLNVTRWYEKGMKWVFQYPVITTCLLLSLIIGGALTYSQLKKQKFPDLSRDDFEMLIDWNEILTPEEYTRRVTDLLQYPAIITTNAWIGEQQYLINKDYNLGYSESKIYIKSRQDSISSLQHNLSKKMKTKYPLAGVRFSNTKTPFEQVFGQDDVPLKIKISSRDKLLASHIEEAASIVNWLQHNFPDATLNYVSPQKNILLGIRYEQAALYKVEISQIKNALEIAFNHKQVDFLQGAQSLIQIFIGGDNDSKISDVLSRTFIKNNTGIEYPLENFVTLETGSEYKYISGGAQGEYYSIDVKTNRPETIIEAINTTLKKKYPRLSFGYAGSYFYNQQLINEMAVILLISVLLLYFILAAQFESLLQPLIILIELPIDIAGAIFLLYLFNASINLMSMIGLIVMCGIIINDSVLKIDAINQLRHQGYSLKEAIYEAGHRRFRAIVMITLTTIGALLPTLFMKDMGSELQKPLALALIGGMTLGMFVSLFFIPYIYWLIYKKNNGK
ncbi:MAG TPA: efflux RND transporter permease subunit [Niastella sp.]